MTVASERERADALFARVDDIESVAATFPDDDPRRDTLARVIADELASADPIRPGIAASLLNLNEKTIRAWLSEGVLTVAVERPRVQLDATRLYEVLILVRDLRAAGKTRGLLDEVYRRLSDAALLDRDDLRESLEQMRRGKGTVVRRASAS